MKKIISVFAVVALLCSLLCGCSVGNAGVITINKNTKIDKEVFTYFLNEAYYSSDGMTESTCIETATTKTIEYYTKIYTYKIGFLFSIKKVCPGSLPGHTFSNSD